MPWAPERAKQLFNPQPPYLLATWVPGKVLTPSIIEFERKQAYFQGGNYPDVLVYSSDYTLKFALAGSANKGLLYNWKYHQFVALDPLLARVQVSVTLDPTDICYGFYSYQEPDVVFTGLDINPFTHQNVRNRIVQFYFKNDGADHYHTIFWQILNSDGSVFQTNDPDQTLGTPHIFGSMVIGTSRGVQSFQTADARNRGGGLAEQWQAIPEAINFWDLGSLDGYPYLLADTICRELVRGCKRLESLCSAVGDYQVSPYTMTDTMAHPPVPWRQRGTSSKAHDHGSERTKWR